VKGKKAKYTAYRGFLPRNKTSYNSTLLPNVRLSELLAANAALALSLPNTAYK